jgi:uncharacterized protein YndB with AHSA1/START domain
MDERSGKSNLGEHGVGKELRVTRIFDASRKIVFAAWTDAKQMAQWWGPTGFTNPVCELDVRPGGAIRIDMRAPDGVVYPMGGSFVEVVPPERIVFTSVALDMDGRPMFENLNTVTFAEQDGKTVMTLHARVAKSTAAAVQYLAGMDLGWKLTLDRLEAFVAKN